MPISLFKPQMRHSLVIKDNCIRWVGLRGHTPSSVRTYQEEALPEQVIEKGAIINKAILEDILKQCIRKWNLRGKKVFIVVPDAYAVIRKVEIPGHLDEHDIRSYLFMEIGQSIHLPFDDPIFDLSILDQKEEQTEILLFAAPEKIIMDYVTLLEDCGTRPIAAELSSLSLYRLYKQLDLAKEETTMFVQFDAGGINVSIFQAHIPLFLREISVNTEDINDEEEATYSDIYAEMERVMNFYQFSLNNGEDAVQRIILTGDHPNIQTFYEKMKDMLTLPVYPLFNESIKSIMGQTIPRQYQVNIGLSLKEVPTT